MRDAAPIKETAEFYRYDLLIGLHSVSDAMEWLDAFLIAEEEPDIALIEASLAGSQGYYIVADRLGEVPRTFDKSAVARRLCGKMLTYLRQDPARLQTVVRWLYEMTRDEYAPDEEAESEMVCLDDSFDMAIGMVYGSVEEVYKETEEFLARYAS